MKKIFLYGFGFLLILVLAAWIFISVYHNELRLKAERYIDRQMNALVTFDHVSVTLLKDFPNITLTLHDLVVLGKGKFDGDTLVTANELDLEIETSSLFREETEIKSLHLHDPQLFLRILKTGEASYDIFSPDSAIVAKPVSKDSTAISLALDQIEISNGMIEYIDELRKAHVLAKGVNHFGAGDFQKEIFDFRTKTDIDEFTLDYGEVRYFSRKEVEINLITEIDLNRNVYTLKENIIRINHFRFDLKGSMGLLADGDEFDLTFATKETDFKNIISLVPGIYMEDFRQISTKGDLRFEGFVKGRYIPEKEVPAFLARIEVENGTFKIDTLPDPIEHVKMNLEISNSSGIRDSMIFNLRDFKFDMRGRPVKGRIKIQGVDHYRIDADVFADLDLAELEKMYPVRGIELKGKVDFELKAKGPLAFRKGTITHIPAFYLNMKLTNGKMKYDHLPEAIDSVQFHLVASNKSGNLEESIIDFKSIHMDLGKNVLHGFARFEGYQNIKVKTDLKAELDLADIETLYPVPGLVMKGRAALDIVAEGLYNKEKKKFPAVDATAELVDGYFLTKDYPDPLENVHLSAEVKNSTGNFDDTKVSIHRLTYSLDDEPFEVRGTIADLVTYQYDFQIKGLVDLRKLAKFYPIKDMDLEGIIITDVETRGKLSDLEAGLYDRTFSKGKIEVKDLSVSSPSIKRRIAVTNALFTLSPRKVVMEKFNGKFGRSNVSMTGDLYNYMSFVTRNNEMIKCDLNLKCDTLDLNEWFAEGAPSTTTQTSSAKINVYQVPLNLDMIFDSEIDYLLYEDFRISKFDGEVKIKDGVLNLHETGFNSLNAAFSFSGDYDTRDMQHPLIDVDLDVKDLDIQRAYKEMKLVQMLLPAAADAEGKFSVTYKLKGELSQDFTPKLETFQGGGVMRIANAKINGMKIFEELSKVSKKNEVNDPHLKDFVMHTEIRDNKVYVKPFSINVAGFATDVEGVSEISGSLRYLVKLEFLPFKIKVPFHVTGTYDNPKVTLGKGHVLQPGDSVLTKP